MKVHILNRKETKGIMAIINSQFGASFDTDLIMFKNGEDIYVANREAFERMRESWRVNEFGLYVGELKGSQVRLGIEGSQMVGPSATKNVLELDSGLIRSFLSGASVDVDSSDTGYVIVKCGDDFLGCSKVKQGRLLNFVPKSRRISAT